MRVGKSGYVESNRTRCCIGKFNVVLSLCGVLGVALYFSKGFLEAAAEALWPLGETVVCFLGVGDGDSFKEGFLVDEAVRDGFALFWEAVIEPEVEAFPCFQE